MQYQDLSNKFTSMKINFLLVFVLIANNLIAQQSDTAIAKAFYHFTHIDDTNRRDDPIKRQMVLYLGVQSSLYRNLQDEESKLLLHMAKGGNPNSFDILEESAARIHLNGKGQSVERLVDKMYLITEDLPVIKWEIIDESKEIEGFIAQKAITHFKGRDYIAWFTSDIPFQFGPWKLHGLPGLILEAYDKKNEIIFTFGGFEQIDNSETRIALPKGFHIQKVTQAEFDKVYMIFRKDPVSFAQSTMGLTINPKNTVPNQNEKTFNNPIELPNN